MGIRTSYEPGVFCWVDLMTVEPEAAKQFYGELLGWEWLDTPTDQGGIYSMGLYRGKQVAAVFEMPLEVQQAGIPSCWQSYVHVSDISGSPKRS